MKTKQKPQDLDEAQQKDQRALDYAFNQKWLEQQEEFNLGGKRLPRNGDNAVYTNFGVGKNPDGTKCGIPAGLPIAFSDPNFERKFKTCENHRKAFPKWDFDCKSRKDLSDTLATDEQIKDMLNNLKTLFSCEVGSGTTQGRHYDHSIGEMV